MFQPKPVPKLPTLIKARVPVWVLAAAIVAQAAITVIGKPSDPACKINVQRVHSSTYSSEIKKLSEVKVKVSTECVIAQSHTVFRAEIEEITANNKEKIVKIFPIVIGRPRAESPDFVLIENLTAPCNDPGKAEYRGRVDAEVHLVDGRVIKISGASKKSNIVGCRISAE
jgi:hypothetical protein